MKFIYLFATLALLVAPVAFAQQESGGFRAEYLQQVKEVEEKLVSLAEATPAEKFNWRPADGVRSISEVYMHVTGGNYWLPKFAGIEPPAGKLTSDMEKTVTEKAKVIEALKGSFTHVRDAISKTSDADLDKPIEFFGKKSTVRDLYFTLATHMHEHLGQSIAYARSNGVAPPWSKSEG